jgi:mono/diheme cytochrome c family protein
MRTGLPWLLAGLLCMLTPLSHANDGLPNGAALFAQHCATCHQADGSGTVGLAPPLKGEHWQRLGAERNYLAQVMLHGLSGLIMVNGQRYVGSMPAFAGQLNDAQLAAVASHLQSLQERPGPAYSAAEMAQARSSAGSPPQSRALRVQLLK